MSTQVDVFINAYYGPVSKDGREETIYFSSRGHVQVSSLAILLKRMNLEIGIYSLLFIVEKADWVQKGDYFSLELKLVESRGGDTNFLKKIITNDPNWQLC